MAKSFSVPPSKPTAWTRATLPRIMLIAGPESALREEAIQALKRAAFGTQGNSEGWVVLHGPSNQTEAAALTPATVLDEVCTRSMFSADDELKVVLVRGADTFLDRHYKLFEEQSGNIPRAAVLAFESAAFGKLKTTGFYKKLAALGAVVECNALAGDFGDTSMLEQELTRRARAAGLNLGHGALLALLARSAKSLSVIEEELAKLALALRPHDAAAAGTPQLVDVNEEHIAEICATTSTATAFNFVDALLDGDLRKALEVLGVLFERGITDAKKPGKLITQDDAIVMIVLGALTYKLSLLQDLRAALDNGKSEYAVFGEFKLFGRRADDFRSALRRHTAATLRRTVDALFNTYLELRRGGGGVEPRAIMEQLVFKSLGT